MFKPSSDKAAHELAHEDVLLWDGDYYIVESATRHSPTLTLVVVLPISPKWATRKLMLQSDLRVMLYTWE